MTNVPCGEELGETTVFVGYLTTRNIKSTRTVVGRGGERDERVTGKGTKSNNTSKRKDIQL